MKLEKIKTIFISVVLLVVVSISGKANNSEKKELKFNKDHKFKIVQFTDIHWKDGSEKCSKTLDIIETVLNEEKPDLVVYTGDIVYSEPLKKGWEQVTRTVIKKKIPWTVVLGNHDDEFDIERNQIIEFLKSLPYFQGIQGPEDIAGFGNYVLSVKASKKNNDAALLYFLDSNAYAPKKSYGDYDWIKFNQVKWFVEKSAELKRNNNKILPALAFFHIPLPEYAMVANSKNYTGVMKEKGISSPEVNSGFFGAMIESKDVMGVFVGHDHDNDFIGVQHDIALAYGRVSGLDAYGDLERGARVIVLEEGTQHFDSWIRTKMGIEFMYHYPNNELYPTSETQFLPALNFEGKQNGVNYKYFEGKFESVTEILGDPIKRGKTDYFTIEPAKKDDYFAFEYDCWIKIPEKGLYQFSLSSDDGSVLFIDGKKLVDNDGSHSFRTQNGTIGLQKGFHKIKLQYFESYMGNKLEVELSSIKRKVGKIPREWLFCK